MNTAFDVSRWLDAVEAGHFGWTDSRGKIHDTTTLTRCLAYYLARRGPVIALRRSDMAAGVSASERAVSRALHALYVTGFIDGTRRPMRLISPRQASALPDSESATARGGASQGDSESPWTPSPLRTPDRTQSHPPDSGSAPTRLRVALVGSESSSGDSPPTPPPYDHTRESDDDHPPNATGERGTRHGACRGQTPVPAWLLALRPVWQEVVGVSFPARRVLRDGLTQGAFSTALAATATAKNAGKTPLSHDAERYFWGTMRRLGGDEAPITAQDILARLHAQGSPRGHKRHRRRTAISADLGAYDDLTRQVMEGRL